MDSFRVTVGKEELSFAAGHFIPLGGECEPLHGHNYRVAVTLAGQTNEFGYVYDFIALKRMTREIIAALDHRLLLPTRNPHLEVTEEGKEVRVRCRGRRYLFPRSDVALLPLSNTTAELLATHLAGELADRLAAGTGAEGLVRVEVEVEESPGQSARYVSEFAG